MFIRNISTGEIAAMTDFIDSVKDDILVESILTKMCIPMDDDIDTVLYYLWFDDEPAWEVIIKEYGMETY